MATKVKTSASLREYFGDSAMIDELLSVPFLTKDTQVVATLAATVNSNLHLRQDENDYFLKCFVDDGLTVDRFGLYQLQLELSSADITPAPLMLAESGNFQIDRWYAKNEIIDSLNVPVDLAKALSVVHQLTPSAHVLNLPEAWSQYCSVLQQPLSETMRDDMSRFSEVWDKQNLSVFCHHDLHRQHILSTNSLCIIDWEYAGYSTSAFDLASTWVSNQLTQQNAQTMTEYYANTVEVCASSLWQDVMQMLPLVKLTHALWHMAVKSSES